MPNRMIESVFSVVQDYPSVAAGTVTFVIAFMLVAGNAFYAQSGTHPEPIWATRDATFTHSVENTIRPVRTTLVTPKTNEIPVPVKRADSTVESSPLVADIQKALLSTGDFAGKVDGLMGPMTRNAIIAYQKRNGFEETGSPSRLLLTAIGHSLPVATRSNDALTGLINSQDRIQASSDGYDREMVRLIQSGLAKNGKQITVDGVFGSQTRAAIEAFQTSHGLKVTGKPDAEVLNKLKELGSVSQG